MTVVQNSPRLSHFGSDTPSYRRRAHSLAFLAAIVGAAAPIRDGLLAESHQTDDGLDGRPGCQY